MRRINQVSKTKKLFVFLNSCVFLLFFKNNFIYLLERKRGARESMCSEKGQGQMEKQTPCWAGSLMQGLIPELWDHDLTRRQMLNWLSHPGTHELGLLDSTYLLFLSVSFFFLLLSFFHIQNTWANVSDKYIMKNELVLTANIPCTTKNCYLSLSKNLEFTLNRTLGPRGLQIRKTRNPE